MKRVLTVVVLVVVMLAVAVGVLLAVTFMGRRALVDGQEVGGLRVVADGIAGLVVVPIGGGDVALVDAGQDEAAEAIKAELARRGIGPDAVAAIFVTHGHPDHIGGIGQFPRAQVMALDAEVPLVEGRAAARGPLTRLFPVNPTGITVARRLRDGETVTMGDVVVRVFAVPGHTAGSAAYLVNGVLIVGDSADVTSDGDLQGSPWLFSDSQAENRASLSRLAQRLTADGATVTAIVPAHSGVAEGLSPLTTFVRGN